MADPVTRRFIPTLAVSAAALALTVPRAPAHAQFSALRGGSGGPALSSAQPVTFTADSLQYDRNTGVVTASGHVEAWQNGHELIADKVTYDRNTDVMAASGHVVLIQPDGQVLFSDYAELTQGMKEGVLKGMSARLAQNGQLAANGARRTEGKLNELSRAVYSTCNVCAKHPNRPPLWQLRAVSAVQDTQHQRIEYKDAELEIYGIPVMYMPYFWNVDPSARRGSGILIPTIGHSTHIGQFLSVPYYWVLDDQSDAIITPTLTTESGPQLDLKYRRRFNDGKLSIDTSLADDQGFAGHIFANGTFDYNDTWRYGFSLNRATSDTYLRDFRIAQAGSDILTSQIYAEGFGDGSYARLDARAYQGLTSSIDDAKLPFVLPRYEYSYVGQPDAWGGRLSIDTMDFNVLRSIGTNTQRASLSVNWERPFTGPVGDLWKFIFHMDAAAYMDQKLNEQPNYSTLTSNNTARAEPEVALNVRWPLWRDAGSWGSQLIEPIAQIIVGPNTGGGQNELYPNEDSLDLQFTDANLFALNRYPGIDRLEGGVRAALAMHGAWYMGGTTLDGLIGQSYRTHKDDTFPVGSGLEDRVSDIVGRVTFIPASWFDITARGRFSHKDWSPQFGDIIASAGVPALRVNAGYIYTRTDPYFLYDTPPGTVPTDFFTPRNEITLGAATQYGPWKLSGFARRDLARNEMVGVGASASYENECLIAAMNFYRRFTSLDGDNGSTTVLFQLTFKTVGTFGFHAF